MGIQKNFVVKNGIEINSNLFFTDIVANRIGIGTTIPTDTLHVIGGIAGTDIYITDSGNILNLTGGTLNYDLANISVANISRLNGTYINGTGINLSGVATAGSYRVGGVEVINSNRELTNISIWNGQSVNLSGVSTISGVRIASGIVTSSAGIVTYYGDGQFSNLQVDNLNINAGIVTATSGIITYYGDGRYLDNVIATGGNVDFTSVDVTRLYAVGLSTIGNVKINAGIVTAVSGIVTYYGEANLTNLQVDNLNINAGIVTATSGIVTYYGDGNLGNLQVDNLNINAGIVTATSGIVTYYGDGQFLTNITRGVGIRTNGTLLGVGATILDLRGSGISTVTISSGIATINVVSGTFITTESQLSINTLNASGIVTASQYYEGNVPLINKIRTNSIIFSLIFG